MVLLSGLPQGNVLGPLLFVICVNDISDICKDLLTDICFFAVATCLISLIDHEMLSERSRHFTEIVRDQTFETEAKFLRDIDRRIIST